MNDTRFLKWAIQFVFVFFAVFGLLNGVSPPLALGTPFVATCTLHIGWLLGRLSAGD